MRFYFKDAIRTIGVSVALLAVSASTVIAANDIYPSRPITMVVPFAAGGTTDILAREIASRLGQALGKTFVVDNRSGAGGTIGASLVAKAASDGYTLLMGGPADQVNAPFLMSRPPYDVAKDFEPVGCVFRAPNLLVVNAKLPIRTVADFVKLGKAEPGKLNFASAGNGNTSHLLGELLSQRTGVQMTHVPYRGNAPAVIDVVSGTVHLLFTNPVSVASFVKSGALRPIAVTSRTRIEAYPDVPTFKELGIDIENFSWNCLMAPAKTPTEILDKLNGAMTQSLKDENVLKAIQAAGGEVFPTTRDQTRSFLASERVSWAQLIRSRNIKAD